MRWLICLLCVPTFVFGSESEQLSRIQAFLVMDDLRAAAIEAEQAVIQHPESPSLREAQMQVLAQQGRERDMMTAWKAYSLRFPKQQYERRVLENLAWGVLHKGSRSSQPVVRFYSLIGAGQSRDVQALKVLLAAMRGSNEALRASAVQSSVRFRDAILQEELRKMWKTERAWAVRAAVAQAIGAMQMTELSDELEAALGGGRVDPEMGAILTTALLSMFDEADSEQVEQLLNSERAALRILACRIITHFGMGEKAPQLRACLQDPIADVRAEAALALGYLHDEEVDPLLARLGDPDPKVAITAAWALTLLEDERGLQGLDSWLQDKSQDWRVFAAGAVAASGSQGIPLAERHMATHNDPFVRINLAIALIRQRHHCDLACATLNEALKNSNERWMRVQGHPFGPIAPSEVKHHPLIPRYPEVVHQATQLEVLNLLAILRYPEAQGAIKRFLQERPWGITSYAAATLLQEGDDSALQLVAELMNDPNPQTRVQAALVLANWGNDPKAINTLIAAYPKANRRIKEVILDSLGKIPSQDTWPFLVQELQNPSQTLRIIAAASLVQSLSG